MPERSPLVFVVDDDEGFRKSFSQTLALNGYRVSEFLSAAIALNSPEIEAASCYIVDVRMPGASGIEFMDAVKTRNLAGPVILMTGHADVSTAVMAMKKGAYDFIEKPFERETALACVARAVEKAGLVRQAAALELKLKDSAYAHYGLVGESRRITEVKEMIETYAATEVSILISGETGTGKELVARLLHSMSEKHKGPFVAVNMASLPESLAMAELFGCEKGAFTGADCRREGKFEFANGGTLFLDEINSASPVVQAGILRAVEERAITRIGGNKPTPVDIRALASTNEDLKKLANEGKFRADLYHRLNMVNIHVPPLRERREDISLLARHFLMETLRLYPKLGQTRFSNVVLRQMEAYSWPGNVRELKNNVVSLALRFGGSVITSWSRPDAPLQNATNGSLRNAVGGAERDFLEETLKACGGSLKEAAKKLDISPRSLFNKMKKFDLNKADFKKRR